MCLKEFVLKDFICSASVTEMMAIETLFIEIGVRILGSPHLKVRESNY